MFPFPTTENLILWACSAIALFAVVFFRRSVRNRRHKRKQQSARRVLERIKTLPGFPQKINYLRKIDPFVFEELLLEGFEAHGGFVNGMVASHLLCHSGTINRHSLNGALLS
ncbi:hypothetical protein [Serratia marcescens]|uniref:hypothetical protein n=1 Tax=Serratia marcescens TaxID=615 RepID=UPI0021ACF4C2|nr:hypothetical protein [Serratia marcescens]